jgi:primosomal protein N' (replication factor Y)
MLPPGTKSKNSSKSIKTKQDTVIKLIKSEEQILSDIDSNVISSPKQIKLLTFLMHNDYVLINDVIEGLEISRNIINTVKKNGYIDFEKIDPQKDLLMDLKIEKTYSKTPTVEQQIAIDKVSAYIDKNEFKQVLLFGVTGSGKTEVYLQLIQKVLNQGKRAIVLVPEISLTYQTVNRFVSRFGNNVAILHSKMTISKRKEEYKRIKRGEVDIVVGARSAIFAPIENIGIVIIDEEHDSSYYSQTTPKYSTKDIASYICKSSNAVLLLGSATPEVTSFFKAKQGNYDLITMKQRPGNATLPKINIVNMKEDRLIGNTSNISITLKEQILDNISKGQQTMLFLNRRGYNSYLKCNDCSFIYKCPNCDVALVYHKSSGLLHCHYCSYVEKRQDSCPSCQSKNITSSVVGTQKIQEELKEIYPNITTLRMDADTTIARDSHQKILDKFKDENINVLIGTQMISKGHDLKNVSLVGIIGVDSMLAMSDYLSSEKAFSNISQVAGRAGRDKIPGRVYIQTSDPDNYILEAVLAQDYEIFYEKEIEYRKIMKYPPFMDIVLFEISGTDLSLVKNEINRLYNILDSDKTGIYKVYKPKAPFIQKINNRYRINVVMKTKLNTSSYNVIYDKINLFNEKKNKNIRFSITRNPMFIG